MRNHPVLNLLVFTCFLVIGYTFSIRFYQPSDLIQAVFAKGVTSESVNSIKTMENGQRSLLLISIDSISAPKPRLESIWLATYFPSQSSIQFLPVFLPGNPADPDFEGQLERSFTMSELDGNLILDSSFTDFLVQHNFWWSGYLVFDETSLTKIFDLFGGVEVNGQIKAGAQVVNELQTASTSPQTTYASQVTILQSVCHKFSQASLSSIIAGLTSLIPDHFLTDLDSSQLEAEVEALYSADGNLTCRFPTLEISRIEP